MTVAEANRVHDDIVRVLGRVQDRNPLASSWSKLENLLLYAAQEAAEEAKRAESAVDFEEPIVLRISRSAKAGEA